MNLTGGNPITAVGLDHYTTKINDWFRTPESLKARVASGEPWDVPARGEEVEVPDAMRKEVTDLLRGAYFGLVCEIIDAGLIDVSDFDMCLELALDMKPAFRFMNEIGTAEALRLVQAYQARYPNFVVPTCLQDKGAKNEPWTLHNVLRQDRDGVAVLIIRRPKVLNALDQGVFKEIADRCREADADSSVKAIEVASDQRFPLIGIVPITARAGDGALYPALQSGSSGLRKTSYALIDHIRSVDKRRILRAYGPLDEIEMRAVDEGLALFLGLGEMLLER